MNYRDEIEQIIVEEIAAEMFATGKTETAAPAVDHRLSGIPIDEPIFVLRATDLLAPVLINTWCSIHALNPKMPPSALKAARELAELMTRWPDRKWPGE